jgi:ribosomal protein L40E
MKEQKAYADAAALHACGARLPIYALFCRYFFPEKHCGRSVLRFTRGALRRPAWSARCFPKPCFARQPFPSFWSFALQVPFRALPFAAHLAKALVLFDAGGTLIFAAPLFLDA